MFIVVRIIKVSLKLALPLIIIGASVFAFIQLKGSKPEPVAIEAPEKQWPVSIVTVQRSPIRPVFDLLGQIESPVRSSLSASVAAEVISVTVREGQQVEEGQELIKLDSNDLKLALNQRDAELKELAARIQSEELRFVTDQALLQEEIQLRKLAERNLSRASKLAKTKAGSQSGVDDALQIISTRALSIAQRRQSIADHDSRLLLLQAGQQRVRAQTSQVEQDIHRTRILAPYAGKITQVKVSVGERVRVGDQLLEIFDLTAIEVRAQVPEKYLPAIRNSLQEGEHVRGKLQLEGQTYEMHLDRLAGQIKTGQGGLDAFFRFINSAGNIELGRVVELNIELPAIADSIALPSTALYGSNTVYRIIAQRLQNVEVTYLGETAGVDGAKLAIVESSILQQGDQVVITQIPAAVNGLKVDIQLK
ncbi:MAG: multidrug resistance efflux pump [Parasphingorhabdus sp.]|jgi:multidrug resistance efflux pump